MSANSPSCNVISDLICSWRKYTKSRFNVRNAKYAVLILLREMWLRQADYLPNTPWNASTSTSAILHPATGLIEVSTMMGMVILLLWCESSSNGHEDTPWWCQKFYILSQRLLARVTGSVKAEAVTALRQLLLEAAVDACAIWCKGDGILMQLSYMS